MLKSVQGIGRAATRANIISTLSKRGYLEIKKKQLHPSDSAKMIVGAVDGALTDPGLTARWEQALDAIAQGKISLGTFQQKRKNNGSSKLSVKHPIARCLCILDRSKPQAVAKKAPPREAPRKKQGRQKTSSGTQGKTCPKCKRPMAQRTVKAGAKAGTVFFGCTGFPACNHSEWPK